MCSACLTPVYPVEKMVVNKVALHSNCFCCRHCKKKLSIHNYSSLYGEFYCISHYQQLFKRKGNYDEGFGRSQHKDRWLLKDKGADEPDTRSTPKITQKYQNPDADVVVKKASTREPGGQSAADAKGKLKISWPPEKKTTGVNPAQIRNESVLKNKIYDVNKAASVSVSESQSWNKLNHRGQITDKVIKEESKASMTSEKSPAGHFHITISSTESKDTTPLSENGASVKNQGPPQTRLAPTLKSINSPGSNRLETSSSKQKKSVRFAPNVDVSQCDLSNQLSSGAEIEMISDQSEQNQSNKPRDVTQLIDSTNEELIDSTNEEPSSKEENTCEGTVEDESYRETTSEMDQELDAEVSRSQEVKAEVNDLQILTGTSNSSADMRQPELPEMLDVNSKDPINKLPSEDSGGSQTPAGHGTKDEACLETRENQLATSDSINDQDTSGNQKKPVARTNSKTKLGSWSKGKSPLSKLFTSIGNDKTTRAEAKDAKKPDAKPSGGLLGRLFQSSPDIPKPPAQHKSNTTTNDDKNIEKEVVTKEKQENVSDVEPLEANVAQTSETDAQGSNCRSIEETNHSQSLISDSGEDPTTPGKDTPGQDSESQGDVAMDAGDPQTQFEDPLSSVINTVSEEPISPSITERRTDESLNNPFNDDIFGDCSSSVLSGEVMVNTDELSSKANKLPKETREEGGAIFDFSIEQSSDLFGLSSPILSFSLTETPEPEAGNINLMDSHPSSAENQLDQTMTDLPNGHNSVPNKQEDPTDPFGANDQTSEEKTDFDLFSSTDQLFSPAVNVSDQRGASTNLISSFPDDIFGVNNISSNADVSAVLQSSSDTFNSLNDLLGSDLASTTDPSAQVDIFAEDLFASEAHLRPTFGPGDAAMFEENLLVSVDKNTEQKSESSSWMDDLLG